MLKIVIILLAGFLLYKLFMGDRKKKMETQQEDQTQKVADGEMVKDPICGTFIPKEGDIRVREGENLHHFCSYECRDKFLKQIESAGSGTAEETT